MSAANPPLISPSAMSFLEEATSAAVGAAFSTTVLYPLEIAKTRMVAKTGKKHSADTTLTTLKKIVSEGGFLALYTGLPTKCSHAMTQSFTYFFLYSLTKKLVLLRRKYFARRAAAGTPAAVAATATQLGTFENLVAGYLAGVSSLGITLPLEVRIFFS